MAAQEPFPGGAALKTDTEHPRLLERAGQYATEGRLDLATVLWQKVLDEAGDTLTTRDGRSYTPLTVEVEKTLAGLPPLALQAYRTSADAEAQALLAAAPAGDDDALAKVVRRFFLSSQGDDAAYRLACLALDRHDFVAASRLLNKIVTRYPDPSIPRAELLLRLAVAAAHLGDWQAAEQALAEVATAPGPRPPADVIDLVRAHVRQMGEQKGDSSRSSVKPSPPGLAPGQTLTESWVREFSLTAAPSQPPATRDSLVSAWRLSGWRPTGRLYFGYGSVYFKSPTRLLSANAAAPHDLRWQSASENHFQQDSLSEQMALLEQQMSAGPSPPSAKPKSRAEVLLFGDRVHQSLALDDGVIYSLEGERTPPGVSAAPPEGRGFPWGITLRRARTNWLAAYDAARGKLLWRRAASDDPSVVSGAGFLGAPIRWGHMLLAPLTDGGTIWFLGLDRGTGQTVWKTYLCDEPPGGASPWSEIAVALEGSEAYLTCGCGVVFAVDPAGGGIRWAVRYQRDGRPNPALRRLYGNLPTNQLDLAGWDDDVVIPHGRLLLVMSSDCDKLLALDRRTGELLWSAPRTLPGGSSVDYCLGIHDQGLFAAGRSVVRRYDIGSGQVVWEKEIETSFGRGCLAANAIYLPLRDAVLQLDLQSGSERARLRVALTTEEPMGNLFTDGEKLWSVGAGRVYALTDVESRLATLAGRITVGDGEAQLARARLRFKLQQPESAVADLAGAFAKLRATMAADDAAQRLFAELSELKLAHEQPLAALQLLTDLFVTAAEPPPLGGAALSRRTDVIASAISAVRQHKPPGTIARLLAAAPLLAEENLLVAATYAVEVTATADDAAALLAALDTAGGSAQSRLLAIRAAARLAPGEAQPVLEKLLPRGDERVRLAAARALANLGQRQNVLETLVALLESVDLRIRTKSQQTLQALTDQRIAPQADDNPAQRAAVVAAWQQWVAANGATARLRLPLTDQAVPLGRTLLVALTPEGQSQLLELDADRKLRWQTVLPGAAWGCQGLPSGNRLVAVYSHSLVIEYDEAGREVWRKDRLPGPPYSVQRLGGGNTLVACADSDQIVEIAPDGGTISVSVPGRPIFAQRLESGNTLVALQEAHRVVEIDLAGKVVWEADTSTPPGHAVRLENGNTLVTLTSARQVVEFDAAGKQIVWQSYAPLVSPSAAQRLADGGTLVADHLGLHELDPAGQQVRWRLRASQVTGVSSF